MGAAEEVSSVLPAERPTPPPAPPRSAMGCPAPPASLSTGGAAPEPAPAPLIGRGRAAPGGGGTGTTGTRDRRRRCSAGRCRPWGCGTERRLGTGGRRALLEGKGFRESAPPPLQRRNIHISISIIRKMAFLEDRACPRLTASLKGGDQIPLTQL